MSERQNRALAKELLDAGCTRQQIRLTRKANRHERRFGSQHCAPPSHAMLAVGPIGDIGARDRARNIVRGLSVTAAAKRLNVSRRVAAKLVG